jgi:hypothetical protein
MSCANKTRRYRHGLTNDSSAPQTNGQWCSPSDLTPGGTIDRFIVRFLMRVD